MGRGEGAFSVINRIFGEHVLARKFVNMAKEMATKACIYKGLIPTAWPVNVVRPFTRVTKQRTTKA